MGRKETDRQDENSQQESGNSTHKRSLWSRLRVQKKEFSPDIQAGVQIADL